MQKRQQDLKRENGKNSIDKNVKLAYLSIDKHAP